MHIDFHCHIFQSQNNPDAMKIGREYYKGYAFIERIAAKIQQIPPIETGDIIEKTVKHAKRAGIDKLVLLPASKNQNSAVKVWSSRFPDIFIPFYNPPENNYLKEAEMHAVQNDLDSGVYKGLKILLSFRKRHLNDKIIYPFLEIAQKNHFPVLIHTGWPPPGTNKPVLSYANPVHLDEVAIAFPGVNFIIAHMGFPFSDIALALATQFRNVYMDISNMTYMAPYRLKELILRAKDIIGTRKILFGSDGTSPELIEVAVDSFKAVDYLNKDDIENIMGLNAMRLLNLK